MSDTPILALDRVSHRYGSVSALEDVSLVVHAGRVTALLGDNGAGKSTIVRIISGVITPSSGRVLLQGSPVALRSPRDARERGIATVHQDLGLVPLMSIWRNFVLGNEPTRGRGPFRRIDATRAITDARTGLAHVDIQIDDLSRAVGTLSGGQRQAIAIARAIHDGARILVLDEPTAALGVRQSTRVLETITQARDHGAAILLITHNPAHAWRVADAFVLLRHGRMAGQRTRAETSEAGLAHSMNA